MAGIGELSRQEAQSSVKYLRVLQMDDGGFRAAIREPASSLGATTSCLRAFRLFKGGIPRPDAIERYLWRCFDPRNGGFGSAPGERPDVRSTAMGLMTAVELQLPLLRRRVEIENYLASRASSRADIYIAAAALDAAGWSPPTAYRWIGEWEAIRRPDGTYGTLADTAGAVITNLRLGGVVDDRVGLLRLFKTAQRPDGGWAAAGNDSDLATTYRVMRAVRMLQSSPDLGRLRRFLDRCRNGDGGYGNRPGDTSQAGPTYYASIVLNWAERSDRGA